MSRHNSVTDPQGPRPWEGTPTVDAALLGDIEISISSPITNMYLEARACVDNRPWVPCDRPLQPTVGVSTELPGWSSGRTVYYQLRWVRPSSGAAYTTWSQRYSFVIA